MNWIGARDTPKTKNYSVGDEQKYLKQLPLHSLEHGVHHIKLESTLYSQL